MRIVFLAIVPMALWQCNSNPQMPLHYQHTPQSGTGAAVTLSGMYSQKDGSGLLRVCGSGETYQIVGSEELLDSLYALACAPSPIPGESAYAVLSGERSADGKTFAVQRVDTLVAKTWENSCLNWSFWCSGTEPFWSLYISEEEGGFFFKSPVPDMESRFFPWKAPQVDEQRRWVYESNGLKAVIEKAHCSDGMSDLNYPYTATITLDGQQLRGCAVRRGGPFPSENQ